MSPLPVRVPGTPTSTNSMPRRAPRGTPAGGQFAATARGEATTVLAAADTPAVPLVLSPGETPHVVHALAQAEHHLARTASVSTVREMAAAVRSAREKIHAASRSLPVRVDLDEYQASLCLDALDNAIDSQKRWDNSYDRARRLPGTGSGPDLDPDLLASARDRLGQGLDSARAEMSRGVDDLLAPECRDCFGSGSRDGEPCLTCDGVGYHYDY